MYRYLYRTYLDPFPAPRREDRPGARFVYMRTPRVICFPHPRRNVGEKRGPGPVRHFQGTYKLVLAANGEKVD